MLKTLINIGVLALINSIPLYLVTFALPVLLRKNGIDLAAIGLFSALMLPWGFKFLWAPLLDRYYLPVFGKRKSWIIPVHLSVIIMLAILVFYPPDKINPKQIVLIICLLFAAATHYLATSAFIFEQLNKEQIRFGNYAQVVGTAVGSFIGGSLFLIVYPYLGWQSSLLLLVLINLLLLARIFVSKETALAENDIIPLRKSKWPSLRAFIADLNCRRLLYICLTYRVSEGLVMGMQQPFLVDRHIPLTTIGTVFAIGSLTINLLAAGLTAKSLLDSNHSHWLFRLGLSRSCCYALLTFCAYSGLQINAVILIIVVFNMAIRAVEMVVLYTIFMYNIKSKQAATDIAILLCAEIIVYSLGMTLSGYLVNFLTYSGLFAIASILSLITAFFSCRMLIQINGAKFS